MKNIDKFDVTIIGFGPAGAFTAYELLKSNKNLKIAIFEKGKKLEERTCPAIENHTNCIKCATCAIMNGCGGASLYSDGKFPITNDFGGNLWEKIGKEKSLELQRLVDKYNEELFTKCSNGVPYPKIFSTNGSPYKKLCTQNNLHLLNADIRHLGSDLARCIFSQLYETIKSNNNVKVFTETDVKSVRINPDINTVSEYRYWISTGESGYYANHVVVATGRSGGDLVSNLCKQLNISTKSNKVDIGIRFECPDDIWSQITSALYESKIVYKTKTYEDEVRTFCMNPSGEVVTENTNGLITVNGHAFEDESKKTNNTNFALLVSQSFTEPFNDSNEYGNAIVGLSNMLGGGVIVQRYGDLIRGKRSTKDHILHNTVIPTLNAEPGDLSLVLPKRILDDIIEMIQVLNNIVPGMTNDDNLLYGVEIKRYNYVVDVRNTLEAKTYDNLYFIGDSSGWTHSLSQSSASGIYTAKQILAKVYP